MVRARRARGAMKVVAITGSSGKSTTTHLLAHILAGHGKTRSALEQNTVFPVLDTIAGARPDEPYAVVEVGASRPGSVAAMASAVRPDIAIVTLVGLDHYAQFRSREAVAAEKGALVECVAEGGIALLNADDDHVMSMRTRTAERVVTFGREREADYRALDIRYRYPEPLTMTIRWAGGERQVTSGLVGEHFWLTVTAAFAAAIELGVPADLVCARIATFEPVDTRCQLYPVKGGPTFLLDCAKSPWLSIGLPMEVIRTADALARRIVFSQISDYPGNPKAKYRDTYRLARDCSDAVIVHGEHAHRCGASAQEVASGVFTHVATVKALHEHLRATAKPGELVLLKGTGTQHLERAAIAFTHDVKCWTERCGKKVSCFACGLYEYPREQHRALERRQQRRKLVKNLKRFLGLGGAG